MTRFRRENEENFHDGSVDSDKQHALKQRFRSHKYGEDWELHEKPKSLTDKTGVVILLGLIGQGSKLQLKTNTYVQ